MKREKIYLSTIATDAVRVAQEHGFGLEIAEYCTAWNMDEKFVPVDGVVKKKLEGICASLLHAPYNELFPCAIDKKARGLHHHPRRCDFCDHGAPIPPMKVKTATNGNPNRVVDIQSAMGSATQNYEYQKRFRIHFGAKPLFC